MRAVKMKSKEARLYEGDGDKVQAEQNFMKDVGIKSKGEQDFMRGGDKVQGGARFYEGGRDKVSGDQDFTREVEMKSKGSKIL